MTDLEITKRCAERMKIEIYARHGGNGFYHYGGNSKTGIEEYNPLHDDTQAMTLVKKLRLSVAPSKNGDWLVHKPNVGLRGFEKGSDLNRTVCTYVAKMKEPK